MSKYIGIPLEPHLQPPERSKEQERESELLEQLDELEIEMRSLQFRLDEEFDEPEIEALHKEQLEELAERADYLRSGLRERGYAV